MGAQFQRVLRQLPGYDPFAQADGFEFDQAEAERRISFIEECCTHIEGALAGQPFKLLEWQVAFCANLFGWKRADGSRRYREALLYIPRKNGKTPLAAAIGHAVMFLDDEPGQQNVLAAADRGQAALLFRHMAGMTRNEPELAKRCRVFRGFKSIHHQPTDSHTNVVSADAHTKHGGNLHLVLFDELHAQPNRDLYDVLVTSQASQNRRQPLMLMISTADFDRPSICNEVLARARAVRDNAGDPAQPGFDPAFLPAIWEAPKNADWTAEDVWRQTNPSLGVAVSLDYLRRECRKAQETPAYENTFKRLHLDICTEQAHRWLNLARWDACAEPVDADALRGTRCYVGIDLSSSQDLTAVAAYFPDSHAVLVQYFLPEDNMHRRVRNDRVPYDAWAKQGLVTLTEGDTIDEAAVLEHLDQVAQRYDVVEMCVDRWGGRQVINRLMEAGMQVVLLAQTTKVLHGAMQELERLYLAGQLRHGGNPVLRWNAANLAVEVDNDEKLKPSKRRSFERIDGISALVNAITRALATDGTPRSRYNSDGAELAFL